VGEAAVRLRITSRVEDDNIQIKSKNPSGLDRDQQNTYSFDLIDESMTGRTDCNDEQHSIRINWSESFRFLSYMTSDNFIPLLSILYIHLVQFFNIV
jgi:hypothetical protein